MDTKEYIEQQEIEERVIEKIQLGSQRLSIFVNIKQQLRKLLE